MIIIFGMLLVNGIFASVYAADAIDPELLDFHKNQQVNTVLFVPDDKPKKILLKLIDHEQHSIVAALFLVTDNDVARALCRACARGVSVQIIIDHSCLHEKKQKISMLINNGVQVHVYRKPYSIMHNKFFIFGRTVYNKALIWTGSSNATAAGLSKNEENIFISDNPMIINRYRTKFKLLWQQTGTRDTTDLMSESIFKIIQNITEQLRYAIIF